MPDIRNVYVFSGPDNYQIFKDPETLDDEVLGIHLELSKVFK